MIEKICFSLSFQEFCLHFHNFNFNPNACFYLKAGISGDKLTIALEPEAASLYCRHLPVEKCGKDKASLSTFGPGKRYLVLDAGGIFNMLSIL